MYMPILMTIRYPTLAKGSPQLRIFLPDFWMKLVKPDKSHPLLPNQVHFIVSPQMTKLDVKQYLEKIYNIPVIHVNIHNRMGSCVLHSVDTNHFLTTFILV